MIIKGFTSHFMAFFKAKRRNFESSWQLNLLVLIENHAYKLSLKKPALMHYLHYCMIFSELHKGGEVLRKKVILCLKES